jgi:hypothetical protein
MHLSAWNDAADAERVTRRGVKQEPLAYPLHGFDAVVTDGVTGRHCP